MDDLEFGVPEGGPDLGTVIPEGTPAPVLTALLTGPVLGTRIFGGRPPSSRLIRIPWTVVADVGVVVRLGVSGQGLDADWVERWIRDKIIARIRGREAAMILGDLLGTPVHDDDGVRLGRVADARFVVDGAPRRLMADARLVGMVVSPHSWSSFLGYERNEADAAVAAAQAAAVVAPRIVLGAVGGHRGAGGPVRPAAARVYGVQPGAGRERAGVVSWPDAGGRAGYVTPPNGCSCKFGAGLGNVL